MELQERSAISMKKYNSYDLSSGSANIRWYMNKRYYVWLGIAVTVFLTTVGVFLGGYYTGTSAAFHSEGNIHTTEKPQPTVGPVPDVEWDGFCPRRKAKCPDSFQGIPPLLLISFDGFRPDYLKRGLTPTLLNLSLCGTSAPYIYPVFPTKTFPNHFSIVTGLHPASHGILDNQMYDPILDRVFKVGKPGYLDPIWWQHEPIWVTAQNQSKRTACYFWPGSEAEINGVLPNDFMKYDSNIMFEERVDSVLKWLDRPPDTRPDFITMYVEQPDKTGHYYGIDSRQVNEALAHIDKIVARLLSGLQQRYLLNCVNIIILSDHGMVNVGCDKLISLSNFINMSNVHSRLGAFGRLRPFDENNTAVLENMTSSLQCQNKQMRVYPKAQLPIRHHFAGNRLIEPIYVDLDSEWTVTDEIREDFICRKGNHGYDNYFKDMRALFMAHGPSFKFNNSVSPFVNVELYEMMAELINITGIANNGTAGSLHHLLQNPEVLPDQVEPEPPSIATVPPSDSKEYEFNVFAANCSCVQERVQKNVENTTLLKMKHLPFGVPHSPEDNPSLQVLFNNEYIAAYDLKYRLPMWAAFTISNELKATEQNICWTGDARILYKDTSTCSDYLVPMVSQQGILIRPLFPNAFATKKYLSEASLITNSVPKHEVHTSYIETSFYQMIKTWLKVRISVNVLTGLAFDLLATGVKPDIGTIMITHAKYGPLVMPTHYFYIITWCQDKDISVEDCDPSLLEVTSFLLPNTPIAENCEFPEDLIKRHVARVVDIESLTGMSLFTGLPTYEAIRLRTSVSEL